MKSIKDIINSPLTIFWTFIISMILALPWLAKVSNEHNAKLYKNSLEAKAKAKSEKEKKEEIDTAKTNITTPKVTSLMEEKPKVISKKPETNSLKRAEKFSYLGTGFTSYIFDIEKSEISFLYKSDEGVPYRSIDNIKKEVEAQGGNLKFAMNAGIFAQDYQPEGLFVNDGEIITDLNLDKGNGNFYLKPNGVFYITKNGKMGIMETEAFSKEKIQVQYATQSGPLLLDAGKMHKAINKGSSNLRVRNGVGIISPTKAVFLISEEEVNFYDFSTTFRKRFGCKEALYLDGVISEMYLPEIGRKKMNQISDFSGILAVYSN